MDILVGLNPILTFLLIVIVVIGANLLALYGAMSIQHEVIKVVYGTIAMALTIPGSLWVGFVILSETSALRHKADIAQCLAMERELGDRAPQIGRRHGWCETHLATVRIDELNRLK